MDAAVTRGGERSFDSAGKRIYTIFSWVVLAMSWLGVLDRLLMPAEQLYAVLGLMLLVLPLVAAGLGVGDSRAERIFGAQVGLVMFLLYGFMPRPQLSLWVAVVVTFGWSGALTALYLRLVPSARRGWGSLLVVVGLINVAALLVARLSVTKPIGFFGFLGGLTVAAASVGVVSVLVLRLFGRTGGGRGHRESDPLDSLD